MVSKRIRFISSLININDKVLDIGTDHAFLPIYLIKNNITTIADGSDLSSNVLKSANENVRKYSLEDNIKLFLSDGIKSIDISKYNTFVIAGMGFHTIKEILSNGNLKNINKMIIQSNNNYEELRKFVNKIGYRIIKDYYIQDKNKTYLILLIQKGKQQLTDIEYACGIYDKNNEWYYSYIIEKYKKILNKLPDKNDSNINSLINYYTKYLSIGKIEE